MGTELPAASEHGGPRNKVAPTDDLLEIQWLCSTYVGQLLKGCGYSNCIEQYCWTGRQNTATRPIRRFTSRSARAIALSIVGSKSPREHLCTYYFSQLEAVKLSDSPEQFRDPTGQSWDEEGQETRGSDVAAGPRDPSAWIQQLSDTSTLRDVCTLERTVTCARLMKHWRQEERINEELATLRLRMRAAAEKPFHLDGTQNSAFLPTQAALDAASDSLKWLIGKFPGHLYSSWHSINELVSKGVTSGTVLTPEESRGITTFDLLNDQRLGSLLEQVCKVVGYRRKLDRIQGLSREESGAECSNFSRRLISQLPGSAKLRDACRRSELLPQRRLNGPLARIFALMVWLKKTVLNNWAGGTTITKDTAAYGALELLQAIIDEEQILDTHISRWLPMPAITSRVTAPDFARSWTLQADPQTSFSASTHKPSGSTNTVQLLSYSFLFGQKAMVVYFRTINHLRMRDAHSLADEAEALRRRITNRRPMETSRYDDIFKFNEEHYLLLDIDRDHVVRDAFDQIWQRRQGELLRPLRVRLGEANDREVGTDLGGVQIEFFNLFCRELFDESRQLFVSDPHTGLSWFAQCSLQPLYMFELAGILVALAIYNGITLPINMPLSYYKLLLGLPCDKVEDIQDGWPTVSRSLAYIRDNETDGTMDYSFPLEANGMRMEVSGLELAGDNGQGAGPKSSTLKVSESRPIQHRPSPFQGSSKQPEPKLSLTWPGWTITSADTDEPVPAVTESNKHGFIRDYVRWLTRSSIWPQWQAFTRGFFTVLSPHSLSLFEKTPSVLKLLVEGQPDFDLSSLYRHAKYEGYSRSNTYMQDFWEIVLSWPQEKQKQLLKFVTAAERIPIGGAESLTFVIKRMDAIDAEWLPSSSTCFGILYLPEYKNARVLEEKLSQAIEFGNESFGTG